ncbi:MAG: hypothetical protein GYB68_10140 [Chloroflexi bacterium]|nr:hypothetical protein [Chloroflexota bacterium]
MEISVRWDNSKHSIIRVTFDGYWPFANQRIGLNKLDRMLDEVEHRVDLLIEFLHDANSNVPFSLFNRDDITDLSYMAHPNSGVVVMVNAPRYMCCATTVFGRMYPDIGERIMHVDNLDDAYAVLGFFQLGYVPFANLTRDCSCN